MKKIDGSKSLGKEKGKGRDDCMDWRKGKKGSGPPVRNFLNERRVTPNFRVLCFQEKKKEKRRTDSDSGKK